MQKYQVILTFSTSTNSGGSHLRIWMSKILSLSATVACYYGPFLHIPIEKSSVMSCCEIALFYKRLKM